MADRWSRSTGEGEEHEVIFNQATHQRSSNRFAGKLWCGWQTKGPGGYDLIWKERQR